MSWVHCDWLDITATFIHAASTQLGITPELVHLRSAQHEEFIPRSRDRINSSWTDRLLVFLNLPLESIWQPE